MRTRKVSGPAPKSKSKTEEDKQDALKIAWNKTQRLRTQSDGKWTSDMFRFVREAADSKNVARNTVKLRFQKRLAEERGEEKKKVVRGKVTTLEKRAGYDWIEFMRKRFFLPTRLEFRCKVIDLTCSSPLN